MAQHYLLESSKYSAAAKSSPAKKSPALSRLPKARISTSFTQAQVHLFLFLWPPLYINKPHFLSLNTASASKIKNDNEVAATPLSVLDFREKIHLFFFFAVRYIYPIYVFSLRIMWFRFEPGGAVVDDVPRIPLWVGSRRSDSLLKIQMEVLLKTGVWKKWRQDARHMDKESKICPLLCLNGFC